jgi:hypothetical protein
MFVQQKTGHDTDSGPCWIGWVEFKRSWKTARFHGRQLQRAQGIDANFFDVNTKEWFWLSGPKRDQTDARYRNSNPMVEDDAKSAYASFLAGEALPGRERG